MVTKNFKAMTLKPKQEVPEFLLKREVKTLVHTISRDDYTSKRKSVQNTLFKELSLLHGKRRLKADEEYKKNCIINLSNEPSSFTMSKISRQLLAE